MKFFKPAFTILLTVPVFGSDGAPPTAPGLRVHEWGTFTSVAGESGAPQPWTPLSSPSDLPCFVYHLGNKSFKWISTSPTDPKTAPTLTSTVRMETPVLYFYASQPTTVSVGVDFPQGWITEWYPQATRVVPELRVGEELPPAAGGHIEWKGVTVTPGSTTTGPTGVGASHYYTARNTEALPVNVAGQAEKFLFYRGIANFPVPLWARVVDDTKLELRNTGAATLPLAIVFENRGGKIGYRMARELMGTSQVGLPDLNANLDSFLKQLATALVDLGLYPKEAQAMIETWRDSWFEEGLRVFYLMPRRSVDAVLPLAINPAPIATERVFVGRVEILSPSLKQTLGTALAVGDTATLGKYGRFLEPFSKQISSGPTSGATAAFFQQRYSEGRRQFDSPSCVK